VIGRRGRRRKVAPSAPRRYQLLGRAGCHLCDDLARLLDEVMTRRGLRYESIDIDGEGDELAALRARYSDVVPVLLRDGVAVAKVRLDQRQLERILDERR
jgi:glutaredoxin